MTKLQKVIQKTYEDEQTKPSDLPISLLIFRLKMNGLITTEEYEYLDKLLEKQNNYIIDTTLSHR